MEKDLTNGRRNCCVMVDVRRIACDSKEMDLVLAEVESENGHYPCSFEEV